MSKFSFRDIHLGVDLGTASDRYAGWIGQIYTGGRYEKRISSRTKRLGGRTFEEKVLPVESVREYFRHFSVLEIDFTFYRPLMDDRGNPSESYHALQAYAAHIRPEDRVILKAPQLFTARHIRRGKAFTDNDRYLDCDQFTRRFYEPAVALLGDSLDGFVLEQEYQRARERQPVEDVAEELRGFFRSLPQDDRYHLELRTESYLKPAVFDVLEESGVGQVLSHWTWLPPLREQFAKAAGRIFNTGRRCVIRLLTPLHMRYDETYSRAHPFDKMVEGMMDDGMLDETVVIMSEVLDRGARVTVIVNNRAGGNAPLITQSLVDKFKGS